MLVACTWTSAVEDREGEVESIRWEVALLRDEGDGQHGLGAVIRFVVHRFDPTWSRQDVCHLCVCRRFAPLDAVVLLALLHLPLFLACAAARDRGGFLGRSACAVRRVGRPDSGMGCGSFRPSSSSFQSLGCRIVTLRRSSLVVCIAPGTNSFLRLRRGGSHVRVASTHFGVVLASLHGRVPTAPGSPFFRFPPTWWNLGT